MSNWHKGPPPSVGWWPVRGSGDTVRWWNGDYWSVCFWPNEDPETINRHVVIIAGIDQDDIEWSERPASWPERSKT